MLVQLHNALLLSILYNTTKSTLPSSSHRHLGWQKRRKRDASGQKIENGDPKKRKLKATIMAIGKFERGEIKSSTSSAPISATTNAADYQGLRHSFDSKGAKIGENGIPFSLDESENAEGTYSPS